MPWPWANPSGPTGEELEGIYPGEASGEQEGPLRPRSCRWCGMDINDCRYSMDHGSVNDEPARCCSRCTH